LLSPEDLVVCHVTVVRDSIAAETPAEGAAAGSEPEVAKKGKKEEEGAAKGAAPAAKAPAKK
jgi:hypothetical protein